MLSSSTARFLAGSTKPSRRLERFDSFSFVFLDVEHGIELGDLQKIVDVLAQIHQLKLAALVAYGGVAAHQLPDAGAIDVAHVGQIQQYAFVVFAHQIAHQVTNHIRSLTQPQLADDIYDDNAVHD